MLYRRKVSGAKYDVVWYAQSSMIVNGNKQFSIGWGMTVKGNYTVETNYPTILKSNTEFYNQAVINVINKK